MRLTYWTAFWVFLLDQATKWVVVHHLALLPPAPGRLSCYEVPNGGAVMDVFPPLLRLIGTWNCGINFGLFSEFDARWLLIGIALAVSGFVLLWIAREGGGQLAHVSAGLLVGGAIGNVIDRVLYGAVADFINMSCCGIANPFAFNVADVGVFAGALGLVMFTGKDGPDRKRRRKSA